MTQTISNADWRSPRRMLSDVFSISAHLMRRDKPHKGLLLPIFECEEGREWTFRFKYGRSSETYVVEREWINFSRLRDLKTGDIVEFWRDNDNRRFLITWDYSS